MPQSPFPASHRQRGIGLIELCISLALLAVITAGLLAYVARTRETLKRQQDAQQLLTIARAAEAYRVANLAKVVCQPPSDTASCAPWTGAVGEIKEVTIAMLHNGGFLSQSVTGVNRNGQTYRVLLRHIQSGTPPVDEVDGLLASAGGTPYTDDQAGKIVSFAGASSGFMTTTSGFTIQGAGGFWQLTATDWKFSSAPGDLPTAGHVMAILGSRVSHSGGGGGGGGGGNDPRRLGRVIIPGEPEANTMKTDINMDNNSLYNIRTMTASELLGNDVSHSTSGSVSGPNLKIGTYVSRNGVESTKNINLESAKSVTVVTPYFQVSSNNGGEYFEYDNGKIVLRTNSLNAYVRYSYPFGGTNPQPCDGQWFSLISTNPKQGDSQVMNLTMGGIENCSLVDLHVSGSVYAQNWNPPSDVRLKKNFIPIVDALPLIDKLNAYRFKWRRDGHADIGLIAQDVEKVFPELVGLDTSNGMKTLSYANLVAPLIEAVKELHQINIKQQTELNAGQAKIAALNTTLMQQKFDLIQLKFALHQPLRSDERALCGAACAK